MIAVFLANGYEEIEALAVVDVLRRAGLGVQMVGVGSDAPVGAHGISVAVDAGEADIDVSTLDAVVLPGGMPGTLNLEKSAVVQAAVSSAMERGALVAAICAAPSILDHAGYLAGKRYTCYPGFESATDGVKVDAPVVTDGNLTTGCGPGAALPFALELVRVLVSPEKSNELAGGMQCQ